MRHEGFIRLACSAARRLGMAAAFVLAAVGAAAAETSTPTHQVWLAGAYSFSDELGGFRIISASGSGRADDPITLVEEFTSATPVTLVIRTTRPIRPFDNSGLFANGIVHFRIIARNNSNLPWIEFEFELQERLNSPSVFGDGLSFDQRASDHEFVHSDTFDRFSRDFEPYDRLLFQEGSVDQLQTAAFSFLVTDFTPRWRFYLVQDPRIPSS